MSPSTVRSRADEPRASNLRSRAEEPRASTLRSRAEEPRASTRCAIRAKYELSGSCYVEVDGLSIHYTIEGSGPTLVLLHGVMASLHTWDGWVDQLASSFRIVRIDLPGFGLSDHLADPEHYSPEHSMALFDKLRAALGLERFHIAGNSLGGFMAWYYAVHHPDRVDKLILIDPIAYPQPLPPIMQFVALPGIGEIARFFRLACWWSRACVRCTATRARSARRWSTATTRS